MKDYFEAQGEVDIHGTRDVFRLAFRRGLIEDGETWMEMIQSRTLTMHTYNEIVAKEVVEKIYQKYFQKFQELRVKMESLIEGTS